MLYKQFMSVLSLPVSNYQILRNTQALSRDPVPHPSPNVPRKFNKQLKYLLQNFKVSKKIKFSLFSYSLILCWHPCPGTLLFIHQLFLYCTTIRFFLNAFLLTLTWSIFDLSYQLDHAMCKTQISEQKRRNEVRSISHFHLLVPQQRYFSKSLSS